MGRLIFVPQYPAWLRYQQWWVHEIPNNLIPFFDGIVTLGETFVKSKKTERSRTSMFSPVEVSIWFERLQIEEFMSMEIYEDDILFLADISFPGFFSNVLYHKNVKNAFAFCHATSKNKYDYFQPVRRSKWLVETAHSKLFKKVFVASEYHKRKLKWNNTEVVGLPFPPYREVQWFSEPKCFDIISVARPSVQKINRKVERRVEEYFGKIVRLPEMHLVSFGDYYKLVAQAKVMLITAKEEAFGYQIVDAIIGNCVPIAPNAFSYPELLPRDYLYNNYCELKKKIALALSGKLKVPELLNGSLMRDFYKNIAKVMTTGGEE